MSVVHAAPGESHVGARVAQHVVDTVPVGLHVANSFAVNRCKRNPSPHAMDEPRGPCSPGKGLVAQADWSLETSSPRRVRTNTRPWALWMREAKDLYGG
jgi:hypothetical protein